MVMVHLNKDNKPGLLSDMSCNVFSYRADVFVVNVPCLASLRKTNTEDVIILIYVSVRQIFQPSSKT